MVGVGVCILFVLSVMGVYYFLGILKTYPSNGGSLLRITPQKGGMFLEQIVCRNFLA